MALASARAESSVERWRRDPGRAPFESSEGARLEGWLRSLGTGFLFAVFGIGGMLLAYAVIPVATLGRRSRILRELRAQRIIHRALRLYVRLGEALHLFELRASGAERLREAPGLVIANHPTLLDVVFLISLMPQADCIVKREAWSNPFLRGIVSTAGYIPNDDGEDLVAGCVARLRAGRSVVLFPEGTRSPAGGLGRFRRGAAHVALRSGCRVTPVAIECDPPALMKGHAWYRMPSRKLGYRVRVGEPLTAAAAAGEPLPLAVRRVTAELRCLFEAGMDHGIV
jgi:1-acyl-sn-glycerol-3-phosphate acyltransferase